MEDLKAEVKILLNFYYGIQDYDLVLICVRLLGHCDSAKSKKCWMSAKESMISNADLWRNKLQFASDLQQRRYRCGISSAQQPGVSL